MLFNIQSKKIKYTLGLIGAIFIGAIGSGVWEVALSPAINFVSMIIIDFLSLIFSSLEESIYMSIAKGYTEESSYMTIYLILFIYGFFWAIIRSIYSLTRLK